MEYSLLPVVALALVQGASSAPNRLQVPGPAVQLQAAVRPAPPKRFEGVWAGSLGGRQVRLCFDDTVPSTLDEGRLYELGDPDIHSISRRTDDSRETYKESSSFGLTDGTVRLEPSGQGRLTIYRQFGGKAKRGELSAVPVIEGGSGSCSSAEFLAPRLDDLGKKVAQRKFDGLRYSQISYDPGKGFNKVSMVGVALDGSQPGDAKINAHLQVSSTQWGPGDDFKSCSLQYRGYEKDFQFEFATEVIFLSETLLSVRQEYDGGCGGINDFGTTYAAFDRRTGHVIEPSRWFKPVAGKFDEQAVRYRAPFMPGLELLSVLRSLVSSRPEDEGLAYDLQNCDETGPGDPPCAFAVFLHHDGIGFISYQGGVQMMPRGTVIVPWARIKPFLTPQAWSMLRPAG